MGKLETIIKGMDILGGYEQAEIIDVAQDFLSPLLGVRPFCYTPHITHHKETFPSLD